MKTSIPKIHLLAILTVLFFFIFVSSFSQQKNEFWQHVRFGGGIGLAFGNGYFSGTLAPSAIYEFNQQFAAGVGLNGTYYSRSDYYKATILGGSVLGLYNPIPQIQLSAEFEQLNVSRNWDNKYFPYKDDNYWYPALYLGGGYRAQNVTMGVRFDVLYDSSKSIYGTSWMPFVRFYF